jgi:hypothetical protein
LKLTQQRPWFPAGFWLALAIIFLHALTPSATPWRPTAGSAFNGFTRDVSLGPSRAAPPEKEQRIRDRRDDRSGVHPAATATAALLLLSPAVAAPIRPAEAIAARLGPAIAPAPAEARRARAPPPS